MDEDDHHPLHQEQHIRHLHHEHPLHHDQHMQQQQLLQQELHQLQQQEFQRHLEQHQQHISQHEHHLMHPDHQQLHHGHHLMHQEHQQMHHMMQQEQRHQQMHDQMHPDDDDMDNSGIQVAAEDIITAVNGIGDATGGLDNGLVDSTAQERAALVEALAAAGGAAPPLLLQAEKCLSIQEIVNLCREFEMCDKVSRREFAKARDVSRTKFDRYWKNYRIGKYSNVKLANKRRRVKPGKYLPVENKLVEFLDERKASGIKNDLSWIVLSEKALELAKEVLPVELQSSFRASAGWLYGVLHRNGFIHVDLTGNDNNIAVGAAAIAAPSMKAPPKLTPQPAIVVNGDVTMV